MWGLRVHPKFALRFVFQSEMVTAYTHTEDEMMAIFASLPERTPVEFQKWMPEAMERGSSRLTGWVDYYPQTTKPKREMMSGGRT